MRANAWPVQGAVAGAGMAPVPFSLSGGGGHVVQSFASSATAAVAGGLAASQPARSPPPLSARGVAPPGPTADMAGGRLGSNAEASTSDIGESMASLVAMERCGIASAWSGCPGLLHAPNP